MQLVAYEWLFVLLYAYTMADSAEFASEISQQDFRCALLLLMLTFFRNVFLEIFFFFNERIKICINNLFS